MPLIVGALGVTFGDIGTSPLYALRECFSSSHGVVPNSENIFGVLSLITWTLLITVSLKYMYYVFRADNNGEGGILSLMALLQGANVKRPKTDKAILIFGLIGASLLVGDGIITPAISVLSAVEGLNVATKTPVFEPFVVPLALIILAGLFIFQKRGSAVIGKVFGPIVIVWFLAMSILGVRGILMNTHIMLALNPYWALHFLLHSGYTGFVVLGAVFLVATGGEALYVDIGHFGKKPIRLAWFYLVLPSLLINYFGQGALILLNPESVSNPFFLLAPQSWIVPLVILSTMAAVIASQALISGVFSLVRQGIQLGFLPRMQIVHTSKEAIGQIYVPLINWLLLAGVAWLVMVFKNSSSLASAYGISVSLVMIITTVLVAVVSHMLWKWKWYNTFIFVLVFLTIDIIFVSALSVKILDGGWIPLAICSGMFLVMTTWKKGREILGRFLIERSLSLEEFVRQISISQPHRVPGAAIYMTGDPFGVPLPLIQNLKHFKSLHEKIAVLTIATEQVPFIPSDKRIGIRELAPGFYRVFAIYGYMETPKITEVLETCRAKGIDFRLDDTTFVLGRETILPTGLRGMVPWREKIFALMARNAQRPTAFFGIPPSSVIEVGIQIEI